MANWNDRRRRDDRHPTDNDSNGSWSPYNEEQTHPSDDPTRWEDTRMGMGDQWRHEHHGRYQQRDDRTRMSGTHADERADWRARPEPSRPERSQRGDDRGPARMTGAHEGRWQSQPRDDRGQSQPRDDRGQSRDERWHSRDERWHSRDGQVETDGRWSDDRFRGWRHEHRPAREQDREMREDPEIWPQPDRGPYRDEPRADRDDERRGFRDDQRDWRPEQNRAMHDAGTQRGLHVRDEWRPTGPGDWRRERAWSPDDRRGLRGERHAGDDRHRGRRDLHHRGDERHRADERHRSDERYRAGEPHHGDDRDRADEHGRGADLREERDRADWHGRAYEQRRAEAHHPGGDRDRAGEHGRGLHDDRSGAQAPRRADERHRSDQPRDRDDASYRADLHRRDEEHRRDVRGREDLGEDRVDQRWREQASGANERTWRGAEPTDDDAQLLRDEQRRDEQRRYDEREWQRGDDHRGRHRHG